MNVETWSLWHEFFMKLRLISFPSTRMIRGLEHLSSEVRLRNLELFSLEKTEKESYQCTEISEGWRSQG